MTTLFFLYLGYILSKDNCPVFRYVRSENHIMTTIQIDYTKYFFALFDKTV